jgi:hypothetical protein
MDDTHYHDLEVEDFPDVMQALSRWFDSQGITIEDANELMVHMLASTLAFMVKENCPKHRTRAELDRLVGVVKTELEELAELFWKTRPKKRRRK